MHNFIFIISALISYFVLYWPRWGQDFWLISGVLLAINVVYACIGYIALAIHLDKPLRSIATVLGWKYIFYPTPSSHEESARWAMACISVPFVIFASLNLIWEGQLTDHQIEVSKSVGIPKNQFVSLVCEMHSVCDKMQDARFDCAEAGNIDECINIKMGNRGYQLLCTDQGRPAVAIPSDAQPLRGQCLGLKVWHAMEQLSR